jgi:hypothetical protein
VGEPHPALQGGRIVTLPAGRHGVNAGGPDRVGVPVAFIDFTDLPR